ncbi:MAG TPA: hypothetical protein VK914_01565 [bacterium]|jgi:hypothetical protein|nr:hypothetical protein [bacterium]
MVKKKSAETHSNGSTEHMLLEIDKKLLALLSLLVQAGKFETESKLARSEQGKIAQLLLKTGVSNGDISKIVGISYGGVANIKTKKLKSVRGSK